jgi:hypothetical protein
VVQVALIRLCLAGLAMTSILMATRSTEAARKTPDMLIRRSIRNFEALVMISVDLKMVLGGYPSTIPPL